MPKLSRPVRVLLYGTSYWREIVNFEALVRHGMIAPEDLSLFRYADDPVKALELLRTSLNVEGDTDECPALAKSRTPDSEARPSTRS